MLKIYNEINQLKAKEHYHKLILDHYAVVELQNKIIIHLNAFKGEMTYTFQKAFDFTPAITYETDVLRNSLYINKIVTTTGITINNRNFLTTDGLIIIEGI
jgi:hypothetical protein